MSDEGRPKYPDFGGGPRGTPYESTQDRLRRERDDLDRLEADQRAEVELAAVRARREELLNPERAQLRRQMYDAWLEVTEGKGLAGTVANVAGEMGLSESALDDRRRKLRLTGEWPPKPLD